MKAMLLAAGVGTRLDPLTKQIPKPLVPVANVPVMQHILLLLASHGFTEIVANLHYLPQKLVDYFGDGSKFGVKLTLKYEEQLSGDAGGVRACRNFFGDERFLVINGDLLTDANLTEILRTHIDKKAIATVALTQVKEVSHFGVVARNAQNMITGFQEKPKPEEAISNLASTGIYVLEPAIFEHIPKTGEYGFGRQLLPMLVSKGFPVLGTEIDSYWSDVGTISQYRQSNFDALKGEVDLNLPTPKSTPTSQIWAENSSKIDPQVSVKGALMVGKNSQIASQVTIKGHVVVGDNCEIKAGAILEDTIIWSKSQVGEGASLVRSVIGSDCKIEAKTKHIDSVQVGTKVPV